MLLSRGEDSKWQRGEDNKQKICPHLRFSSAEGQILDIFVYVFTQHDTGGGKKPVV